MVEQQFHEDEIRLFNQAYQTSRQAYGQTLRIFLDMTEAELREIRNRKLQ